MFNGIPFSSYNNWSISQKRKIKGGSLRNSVSPNNAPTGLEVLADSIAEGSRGGSLRPDCPIPNTGSDTYWPADFEQVS